MPETNCNKRNKGSENMSPIPWRDREFDAREACLLTQISSSHLRILIHRFGSEFSTKRRGRLYFSPADMAALSTAMRFRQAGVPLAEGLPKAIEIFAKEPAANAAVLIGDGKVVAETMDFDEAGRLAVEESLTIIPTGRIAEKARALCERIN